MSTLNGVCMITDLMSSRTIGQFPLSIATSLAMEAAFGIYPDRPETKEPILKYDTLWVNVRTIFRNIMGSLEKEFADRVTPPMLANTLNEEMMFINDVIKERANNATTVVFYYSNYIDIEKHFKHGVVRMDNTPKQKEYTALHDLLSDHIFKKLTLLESHTGHFKEKSQWNSKFSGDTKLLNQIPFNSCFIRIFGDDTTFRPFTIKTRNDIIEIAKKYNWSSVSTKDKIRYGIQQLMNPYEKEIILSML